MSSVLQILKVAAVPGHNAMDRYSERYGEAPRILDRGIR
jgi:hypothetical protein